MNEITIVSSIKVAKGNVNLVKTSRYRAGLTGSKYAAGVATVTNDVDLIQFTALAPYGGYGVFKNLDGTNTIYLGVIYYGGTGVVEGTEVGGGIFVPFTKLLPGETSMFRVTDHIYAYAEHAACDLEFTVFEE